MRSPRQTKRAPERADAVSAEGCDPRLIPGPRGPRLLVRLSRDPLLNHFISRYRHALVAHLERNAPRTTP